jgi:hypothetical protein
MATITQAFDELRGRFLRYRRGRPYDTIDKEVGVSYPILQKLARGGMVSERSAKLIERWCDTEAKRQADAGENTDTDALQNTL